ncbi:MAG: TonB-dependent receptor domain-containing protein [Gemmatimonadaceae bacterium]
MAAAAVTVLLAGVDPAPLAAQGVTTGAIGGVVTDASSGAPVEGVQVQIVNRATGFTRGAQTRGDGRYSVLGLEPGDRYAVTARRIGFQPSARENVVVVLSQTTPVSFSLATQAATLSAVTVTAATTDALITPSRTGAVTTITDSALRRLPTLNRNFTDFAILSPQVGSTTSTPPGLTGAGTNQRFNNIQIDGATEADVFGLGQTGQPGGNASGKSISIESVKEYQVLLSPYDVRQGNFSGALINAVTKSGTNEIRGSAYYYGRNQSFTRTQPYIIDYNQQQYGFSVGGPIVKNKAFFFVNPEFQQRTEPATGPYLGAPGMTFTQDQVNRFNDILTTKYGLPSGGSAGQVNKDNPLSNVFARLDFNLPYNSQLVLRHNYGGAKQDIISRTTGGTTSIPLSNNAYRNNSTKNATVAQLRTNFAGGAFNEIIGGYTRIRDKRTTPVTAPEITVNNVSGVSLVAGTERSSQANELDQDILELTDNYTLPLGSHRLTIGSQNQFFKFRNLFRQNSFGAWTFGSLDSLDLGLPRGYLVGAPTVLDQNGQIKIAGDGAVRFKAAQYSAYAQDQWTVTDRLNVTAGLRVDVPVFSDKPPTNPAILTGFGRNTADVPSGNAQWSPRVSFNWDVTGDRRNQLRGGIGSFTGRPAYVWLSNSFQNSGASGVTQLSCNNSSTVTNKTPVFDRNAISNPPTVCKDSTTLTGGGEVDLLGSDLNFPQNLRVTLGYDRDLGHGFVGTLEGLYTRGLNNPFYTNIALDPNGVGRDRNGRFLYGGTAGNPLLRVKGRSQVFDVQNQSRDYSYSMTGQIARRFQNRFEGSLSYTWTQAFEVQGLTSSTAFSQYRFGRVYANRQDDMSLTHSRFEVPHRIVATGTYTLPTHTDVSVIYTGQSGNLYDYVSSGDLNGDGLTLNDPIYVPKSVYDANEIRFSGRSTATGADNSPAAQAQRAANQQAAFERFVQDTKCLREQRGKIMERNSCRAPWTNLVNLSAAQSLPTIRGQNVKIELQIFNFLNLLNNDWGLQPNTGQIGSVTLLNYQGIAPGTGTSYIGSNGAIPLYTFDNGKKFNSDRLESNYQIQLGVRYGF